MSQSHLLVVSVAGVPTAVRARELLETLIAVGQTDASETSELVDYGCNSTREAASLIATVAPFGQSAAGTLLRRVQAYLADAPQSLIDEVAAFLADHDVPASATDTPQREGFPVFADLVPAGNYGILMTKHGELICGTLERATGVALVSGGFRDKDGAICPDYDGETKGLYDSQETVTDAFGDTVWETQRGHEVSGRDLVVIGEHDRPNRVVYSANEAASNSGFGFWNAAAGHWTNLAFATRYRLGEQVPALPTSVGNDAVWLLESYAAGLDTASEPVAEAA